MIDLPNTLTAYKRAVKAKQIDPNIALKLQQVRFHDMAKQLKCVVDFYDTPPLAMRSNLGAALAHKDIFDQSERAPGMGLRRGLHHKRIKQAHALQRLELAGFADLGALSMAPDACSSIAEPAPTAENTVAACLNPLDSSWCVGGSSSGSAVAVASGAIFGSLGSDTAGSVRIPAFTCGILGLKPTLGLIRKHGMVPLSPSLDTIGILTRSAQDIDVLLEVITTRNQLVAAKRLAHSYRVKGWVPFDPKTSQLNQIDAPIAQILTAFHKQFGHAIQHTPLKWLDSATLLQSIVMNHEVGETHKKAILNGSASPAVRELGVLGMLQPREWYAYAQTKRSDYLAEFVKAHFADTDILITPAYAYSLPDADEVSAGSKAFNARKRLALHRFTGFVNYLGLPALVMPIGQDKVGKPISIQLLAKPFHERALISYASHIEKIIFGENGILPTHFKSGH